MQSLTLELGIAPDVTVDSGLIYLCYGALDGRLVFATCEMNTHQGAITNLVVRSQQIIESSGCSHAFPRLEWPWLVYRGPGGATDSYAILRDLRSGQARSLWAIEGNHPVALGAGYLASRTLGRHNTYVVKTPHAGIADGQVLLTPERYSDGISRILPGPQVIYVAETYPGRPYAESGVTLPAYAGDLMVGELPSGGILARLADGRELRIFEGQETREPRCAVLDAERFIVCCWGQPGIRLAVVSRSEFGAVTPSPEPGPPVAPLHPMWFTPMHAFCRHGIATGLPSNCMMIHEPEFVAQSTRPIIIEEGCIVAAQWSWSKVIAVYVAAEVEGTIAALDAAADRARSVMTILGLTLRPIWGYWPRKLQDQGVPQRCIPAVEAYIYWPETVAGFQQRMRAAIDRVRQKPWVLVAQTYDRASQTTDDTLRAIQPLWPELARDPNCQAILSFSA